MPFVEMQGLRAILPVMRMKAGALLIAMGGIVGVVNIEQNGRWWRGIGIEQISTNTRVIR